jgi:hypothetical protein
MPALPLREKQRRKGSNRNAEVQTAQKPRDCLAWVAFKRRWPIGQFHAQAESDPHAAARGTRRHGHFQAKQGPKAPEIGSNFEQRPNRALLFWQKKQSLATSFFVPMGLPCFGAEQS